MLNPTRTCHVLRTANHMSCSILDFRIHLLLFFFLLKSKRTSKKHIQDGGQRRTASENIVDISKDYELNNICHENIIAPINKLWLKELDMTKSVQW